MKRWWIAFGALVVVATTPSVAQAGPYAGPAMGEAAGRAAGGKLARRMTGPVSVGGAASLDADQELRGTVLLGLGALLFGGRRDPELLEDPLGGLGFEVAYTVDDDAWGTFQLWMRIGLGPITVGGALGVAAGREDPAFVIGPEVSFPVRIPLAEDVDGVIELFVRGEAFTLPSQYPHRLLIGGRLHAW